jgi:hypothetical protein
MDTSKLDHHIKTRAHVHTTSVLRRVATTEQQQRCGRSRRASWPTSEPAAACIALLLPLRGRCTTTTRHTPRRQPPRRHPHSRRHRVARPRARLAQQEQGVACGRDGLHVRARALLARLGRDEPHEEAHAEHEHDNRDRGQDIVPAGRARARTHTCVCQTRSIACAAGTCSPAAAAAAAATAAGSNSSNSRSSSSSHASTYHGEPSQSCPLCSHATRAPRT